MAIPFAHLAPVRLTENGGAVRNIAYTARASVHDPRCPRAFDYSHLRGDLAHEEIILPDDCPPVFLDRSVLAIALDDAEFRKVRTPLSERKRQPQVGLALILALPPSTEVSVAEAAEILRRIVLAARGSEAIPIHLAIHEATINRHAHALFGLRPVGADGVLGLKLRDFLVLHRRTGPEKEGADVVEGIKWPDFVWETQQNFFQELGIDLVVDPIAPIPGKHFAPIVYSNLAIHSIKTRERIASTREQAHEANVRAIQGSPTHLIEALLRGRASLRIAELERLCAKFFDDDTDQLANVDRVLLDQNVITLAHVADDKEPWYATTRRIYRLMARAARLVDESDETQLKTFTGLDQAAVLARISDACATAEHSEGPLLLGAKLSDCNAAADILARYNPIPGTIDMVIGSPALRELGRKRDVRLRPGRHVIVPHADLIDDQRLARLMVAVSHVEAKLILGHDQSSRTGVVSRYLAAYAADCAVRERASMRKDLGSSEIVRLLRAGLVRHAIDEMTNRGLLEFGGLPNGAEDASLFVACDDPRRIGDLCRTIRARRAMSGSIGEPVILTARSKEAEFSVGEWIVVTEAAEIPSTFEDAEFAQILGVDPANASIDVVLSGETKRIDLKRGAAARPASVLSIREARRLFAGANLAVEVTDPRRLWSALLLVASRGQSARLHVDPKIALTKAELIDVARRSLPGALPHQRTMREDPDAGIGMIMSGITNQFEVLPETTPVEIKPPRPINATPELRRLVAYDSVARDGYKLLYDYVGPHNPDHIENTRRALSLYRNELTKTVIRFLAGLAPIRRDPGAALDLPRELEELEPERWTSLEVDWLKSDLWCLTIPGRDCPIKSSLAKPKRSLPSQRTTAIRDIGRDHT